MKKYIQLFVVFVLVLTVIGLAQNNSAWAGKPSIEDSDQAETQNLIKFDPKPPATEITETGIYNIGGICTIDVEYLENSGLSGVVDIDVPTDFSSAIPFGYIGDLYLPGCHIVHYKNDKVVREISTDDGSSQVCFAERPEVELTIYYYYEEPFTASQIWMELETTHEDGFACASAIYTGEYAPGSKIDAELEPPGGANKTTFTPDETGSIAPPPYEAIISRSGTYAVGGVCTLIVLYKESYQTNEIHVADALRHDHDPVDDYNYEDNDLFPVDEGLLYLPGCHVLHYKRGEMTYWEKYINQGEWEICFAAQPNKEMTIYYYLGDLADQASSWVPLETTVDDGQACAPAFYTGVYVPSGK